MMTALASPLCGRGRARIASRSAVAAALYALFTALGPTAATAAGYGIGQESVGGMGVAGAGGSASALDASTIFYNPAGMTRLHGTQITTGAAAIFPFVDYDEKNSVLSNGNPYNGGEGEDGGQNALVPHFYGVHTLDNGLKLGLGIYSPFGLVTDYEQGWKGRYSEITTQLKTFNFNPSIAGSVGHGLSLGAGINVQYARGTLVQAIDFGSFCAANGGACGTPGQADGTGKVTATAVGYGFNAGVLYEPTPETRFGAHYRSRVNLDFEGRGDYAVPAAARAFLVAAGLPNSFTQNNAEFILVEPEMASVSAYHDLTDRWAIMGDVTWTRWGVFPGLRIDFDDQTPDNVLATDWSNVFRYSAGVAYKWSNALTLRTGLAFDDSPIKGDFRGPGIPDSDRIIVSVGFGYAISDSLWLDAGYQHLFFKTGNTRRISATNSVLNGDFEIDVDVFGLGVTWKW